MRFTDNAELTAPNMENADILAGTDVSTSTDKKFTLSGLADWLLNRFTGLSLAGSNQSVKAALDGLNSTLFQNVSGNITADNIDSFTTRGIYSAYITATTILGTSAGNSYGLLVVSCPPTAQRIGQYLFLPSAGIYATRYNGGSSWSAWTIFGIIDYTDRIQLESGVTKTSPIDSFFYRSGNVCTLQLRIQINATTTANTKLATLPIAPKVYANNANGVVFRAFNIWGANTSDVSCYIKPNGELWVSAGMTQQADYLFNVTFMA